jgi:hypothetical protein
MLNEEASNTHSIVLGLLRLGLELAIHRTQGEHSNHYTTDVVHIIGQHIKLKRRAPKTGGGGTQVHMKGKQFLIGQPVVLLMHTVKSGQGKGSLSFEVWIFRNGQPDLT